VSSVFAPASCTLRLTHGKSQVDFLETWTSLPHFGWILYFIKKPTNQPNSFFEEMLGLESLLMREVPSYSYSCSIVHCETFTITEIFTIFHFLVCSDCGLRAFSLVNDLTSGSYHYCFVRSCVAEHRQKNSVLQLI